MDESRSLRDASIQEIQLELIRRTRFNAMDGRRVVDGLSRHRDLWESALLDRPGLADFNRPRSLLAMSLVKLRDLSKNLWNTDTLYVLTPSPAHAASLKQVAEDEEWGDMAWTIEDRQEIDAALGSGRSENGLLVIWWD